MESRVAEVRASAKDDLEEETRSEIMSMRKQHIEEMGEMRKRDEQYFEVSLSFFLACFFAFFFTLCLFSSFSKAPCFMTQIQIKHNFLSHPAIFFFIIVSRRRDRSLLKIMRTNFERWLKKKRLLQKTMRDNYPFFVINPFNPLITVEQT